jgi:hypothetical protein
MAKKPQPFVWGVTPDPTNWHQAAQALKNNQTGKPKKPQSKGPSLIDRLLGIETLLKERT